MLRNQMITWFQLALFWSTNFSPAVTARLNNRFDKPFCTTFMGSQHMRLCKSL
jgi:hypothetical protein